MTHHRNKLHPSSCFPSNPPAASTKNRLLIRIAPNQFRHTCPRLTFIGINATTHSAIAALLAYQSSTSIECIKLFDACEKLEPLTTLNDLQVVAVLNKSNVPLHWAQSYWETKDSTVIIINVQHHRLDNESISTWTQMNASLVEDIVSQTCIYSPQATLIVCTEPNELMTYVAWRASGFPSARILGLGASVETAYAHKTVLDQMENIHGRVNGCWMLGNGRTNDSCTTVLTNHLTIDGICFSDIRSKLTKNQVAKKSIENQFIPRNKKPKEWDLLKFLKHSTTVCSDLSRRPPVIPDINSRQKTVMKYLRSDSSIPHPEPKLPQTVAISLTTKARSNWTEAMLIVHIIRAVINNHEFQSNFAVNIAPMNGSRDVFYNYPTIIGSSHGAIKYMLPFQSAHQILQQRSNVIPFERAQMKIRLVKSKD